MSNQLRDLITQLLDMDGRPTDQVLAPTLNAFRDRERYALMIPLPGVKKENVKLDIIEKEGEPHLHLHAEYRDPFEGFDREKGSGYLQREYPAGKLERCLGLPDDVNPEKITSEYADGMLTVHMPRDLKKAAIIKPSLSIAIKTRD